MKTQEVKEVKEVKEVTLDAIKEITTTVKETTVADTVILNEIFWHKFMPVSYILFGFIKQYNKDAIHPIKCESFHKLFDMQEAILERSTLTAMAIFYESMKNESYDSLIQENPEETVLDILNCLDLIRYLLFEITIKTLTNK